MMVAMKQMGLKRLAGMWTWGMVLVCVLAVLPIVVDLYSAVHPLRSSWDDGAITAAFARTWAQSGRIALTPSSAIVEGYSSALWMVLLSVPSFFSRRPELGVVWMKVLAGVFAVLCLPVLYRVARRQIPEQAAAGAAVLLFAYSTVFLYEIRDGMEMTLAALLLLVLFELLTRERARGRVVLSTGVACLLVLTRFEAPFQLVLLLVGMLYAVHRRREAGGAEVRELLLVAGLTVGFFCLVEVWRHHTFGVWMPNTVYAKRHAPYSVAAHSRAFLQTRWYAMKEPTQVLRWFWVLTLLAFATAWTRGRAAVLSRVHPAWATLACGCFLFGLLFGQNWGYAGRMILPLLPFFILTGVGVCAGAIRRQGWLLGAFGVILLLHGIHWARQVLHPFPLISMGEIQPVGMGAESIREALHRERLVVMISDVGASTLCCERLTVVDQAFLTDPTLSHTGWAGFAPYFRRVNPELVETHSMWAEGTGIYRSGLLDGYSLVAADGMRFFLRNDLYGQLLAEHAGAVLPVSQVPACMPPWKPDAVFSLSKGTCLVLNGRELQNNFL